MIPKCRTSHQLLKSHACLAQKVSWRFSSGGPKASLVSQAPCHLSYLAHIKYVLMYILVHLDTYSCLLYSKNIFYPNVLLTFSLNVGHSFIIFPGPGSQYTSNGNSSIFPIWLYSQGYSIYAPSIYSPSPLTYHLL